MSESIRPNNAGTSVPFRGALTDTDATHLASRSVLVTGLGNIGSNLGPLLARMKVRKVLLIDRGRIEPKNFANQAYEERRHAGQPKAIVIAEQLRRIDPNIIVEPIVADVEDVPLGKFAEVDLCMGGLDSLQARQITANERAYRLGVPYIDGGVDAGGDWIGRVQVFPPGKTCIECSWGQDHYRQIGRETPCDPDGEAAVSPTLAPALIGIAVASLMVAEGVKILLGHTPYESFEIMFDLSSRRWLTSTLRRASRCRFDHQVISETLTLPIPFAAATVGDLLAVLRKRFGDEPVQLEFRRRVFDTNMYRAGRFIPASHLENISARRLAELRLSPDDRIRVEHGGTSVAVALCEPT